MWVFWDNRDHPDLGKNLSWMLWTLLYVYSLDGLTKIFLYLFKNQKPALFRLSALTDDLVMLAYGTMVPVCYHNHWQHFLAISFRDMTMATGADIWRIYAWPDNEHNRKR